MKKRQTRHRQKFSRVVKRLAGDRPAVVPFRELPTEAKYAIVHYMCVDGEAWPEVASAIFDAYRFYHPESDSRERRWYHAETGAHAPLSRVLDGAIPVADRLYGDLPFGYAEVPMATIVDSVMRDEHIREFGHETFDEYHRDFVANEPVTAHRRARRWPVILSSQDEHGETLQDGWHRLHSYYRSKHPTVPVVFYAY